MGVLNSSGGSQGSCWLIYGCSGYNSISPCNEVIMKNWFHEHNNCPAFGRPSAFSLNQLSFGCFPTAPHNRKIQKFAVLMGCDARSIIICCLMKYLSLIILFRLINTAMDFHRNFLLKN